MARAKTVWGIDIGQCALKALKLSQSEGQLQVEALDIVEHPTILSQSEGKQKELIQDALATFLSRNRTSGSTVAITVPGFRSLTSFVKLPPVEPKRVPSIVAYEAREQIPFPLEQVIWRWQTFHDPDSPDVEVGIFAIQRADIDETLDYFRQVALNVDLIQMAPLALYNFLCFDQQAAADRATLLMDVGADKTDLVVADGPRLWTRTIQIGGSNFTGALVKAFKLSFQKAEQLKRTAATSKYARQVFQSMRPVFSDLVQEVQRSIGYYTSVHREAQFQKLVGLGNGFRLPGLQRFLEQNLNMPVARVDSYNRVKAGGSVSEATFSENVLSLAVAYGTAVEAMGEGKIQTNLLPTEILRRRVWSRKRWWFAAAAVLLLAVLGGPLFRARADRNVLTDSDSFERASRTCSDMQGLRRQAQTFQDQGREEIEQIKSYGQLLAYRDFIPAAQTLISRSIRAVFRDQDKLVDYPKNLERLQDAQTQLAATKDENTRKKIQRNIADLQQRLKSFTDVPRNRRWVIFIESMSLEYIGSRAGRSDEPKQDKGPKPPRPPAEGQARRYVRVTITARTPLEQREASEALTRLRIGCKAKAESKDLQSVGFHELTPRYLERPREAEAGRGAKPGIPDPMIPGEDMSQDTRFEVTVTLYIKSDGLDDLEEKSKQDQP